MKKNTISDLKKSDTLSLVGILFNKGVILIVALLFLFIASKNLTDPVGSAGELGIMLTSPGAITVGRIGFGAFPFSIAVILLGSLYSLERLRLGVYAVSTLLFILTIVRVAGLMIDGYAQQTIKVLRPEIILMILSFIGLYFELRRKKKNKP